MRLPVYQRLSSNHTTGSNNRFRHSHCYTSAYDVTSHVTLKSYAVFVIMLSSCSSASADSSETSISGSNVVMTISSVHEIIDYDLCPVQLGVPDDVTNRTDRWSDQRGSCVCNWAIKEIHCHGLYGIPPFTANTRYQVQQITWQTVHMSRQSISRLNTSAFRGLRTSRLVLNFNPIADRIAGHALSGLESVLVELQLGACQIRILPAGLLVDMVYLQRLHLWGNVINKIPAGFFRQAWNLRELLLWGNNLTELNNDTLAGLWKLQRLDLDRNNIVELEKNSFRHLLALESLHLAHNKIQFLHEETFAHMTNLRALSLAGNRINYIHPRAFDKLDRLVSLALNDNQIRLILENVFVHFSNLIQLFLHNNAIDLVFTKTFAGLQSLHRLHLSGNKLRKLPNGALRHSPNLRHLDLDDNQLEMLGRCALPLPQKRMEWTLTRGGSAPAAGRKVSSTSGRVASAPTDGGRSRLRYLSLIGNPMICDCRLAWIVDFHQQITVNNDSSMWPLGPTVRGTCRDRPASSGSHHASADNDHGARRTSSNQLDVGHHQESSIASRSSQLIASCSKEQLHKASDCHNE